MIDLEPTPEQSALRAQAVAFARRELASESSSSGEPDLRALWRRATEIGLPGLVIPADHGGAGRAPLDAALVLEGVGYGCGDPGLVFALGAHLLAVTVPVWKFGSAAQKRDVLPLLCGGRAIGAFAASEPQGGSDPAGMQARAVADGTGFRLDGVKTFVTNAPIADWHLVLAVTDPEKRVVGGITAFLVERDRPGCAVRALAETLGHRGATLGEIVLEGVRVPREAVLGGVGAGTSVFQEAMNWERTLLFAAHVGLMERVLEEALREARTRKLGGRALSRHQAIAHPLADAKVRLEAARWLVYRAASRLGKSRAVALDAAIAKLFVSESLLELSLRALRLSGARGYLRESAAARALGDAVGTTLYSGTSEIQREFIARWLGL